MKQMASEEFLRTTGSARLHTHVCYSCGDSLTCCCIDRRQTDRATGKERRILCDFCAELEKQLKEFYGEKHVELEKVQ